MATTWPMMAAWVADHHTISPIAVARWTCRTNVCAFVRWTRYLIVPLITCMRVTRAYRISFTLWNVRQVAEIMCRAVRKRTSPTCVRWAKCIHITTLLHKFPPFFFRSSSSSLSPSPSFSHTLVHPVALCSPEKWFPLTRKKKTSICSSPAIQLREFMSCMYHIVRAYGPCRIYCIPKSVREVALDVSVTLSAFEETRSFCRHLLLTYIGYIFKYVGLAPMKVVFIWTSHHSASQQIHYCYLFIHAYAIRVYCLRSWNFLLSCGSRWLPQSTFSIDYG